MDKFVDSRLKIERAEQHIPDPGRAEKRLNIAFRLPPEDVLKRFGQATSNP